MSIWQNFKEADLTFEKKFFKAILVIAVGTIFFVLVDKIFDKAFDKIPDVKKFFSDNIHIFSYFIIGLIITAIITILNYYRTLDWIEAETKATIKASIINVIVWIFFWATWSIACAWITINFNPLTVRVQSIIITLVSLPGLILFFTTKKIRHEQTREEEESKKALGDNYYKTEPYTIRLDKKYYSGYYGLICLPIYLIAVLIEHVL